MKRKKESKREGLGETAKITIPVRCFTVSADASEKRDEMSLDEMEWNEMTTLTMPKPALLSKAWFNILA